MGGSGIDGDDEEEDEEISFPPATAPESKSDEPGSESKADGTGETKTGNGSNEDGIDTAEESNAEVTRGDVQV